MKRPLGVILVAASIFGTSCDPPEPVHHRPDAAIAAMHFPEGERASAIADGKATIAKHQCTRCHVIDDIPPGPRPLHCTSCHEFLKGLAPGDRQYKEIASKYGEAIIQRYQKNIWHLRQVPNLTMVGKRLRPEWIATFLSEPFDVRPVMTESMIRHRLSSDEIMTVARYFAAVADVPWSEPEVHRRPSQARVHAGGVLLVDKGCGRCHTFGNVPLGASRRDLEASYATSLLAPNLRFVRDRMRRETVEKWIVNPQSVLAHATMPAQDVTPEEASKITDYLFWGDPDLAPAPEMTLPEVRPVAWHPTWEEVKERVIGRICVHCHMNDYEKDKGPGNKGGFGYPGTNLAFRTYESLVYGAQGPEGRYSVLVPRNGEPYAPIVMAMLRRRVEAARDQVPPFEDHERPHYPANALPGMPLGLPAMSDEEIGIVQKWIEDGCPGPTKVTGMAGIYDGFLVPDGPIANNKGCEVRAPSKTRPEWARLTEKRGAEAALQPLK
jgi:cytochrome c5